MENLGVWNKPTVFEGNSFFSLVVTGSDEMTYSQTCPFLTNLLGYVHFLNEFVKGAVSQDIVNVFAFP